MSHQLRSRDGSEYLIQHDSEAIISTWHKAIAQGIQELVGRELGAAKAGGEGMGSHYAGQLCPLWVGPSTRALGAPWHRWVSSPLCRCRWAAEEISLS